MESEDLTWKYIPHYPDYVVSDQGDVVNLKTNQWLNFYEDDRGYSRVTLYNVDGPKHFYVHQLVAMGFIFDYEVGVRIRHRNGRNYDNRVENLQLLMGKKTRYKLGISDTVVGRRVKIVETGQTFKNAYACAKFLNTNATNIYRVLRGEARTHLGYTFEYVTVQVVLN